MVISGLRLTAAAGFTDPLITITRTGPVHLERATIANATSGIALTGNHHRVSNSTITCTTGSRGTGVSIVGHDSTIIGGTIQNCGTGLS